MHRSTLARQPIFAAFIGAVGLSAATAHADSSPSHTAASSVTADAAAARASSALLDPVTVTATRTATAASRTAASVSVIDADDLDEQQATNIKDALRYEPGITVRRTAYRPGNAALGGAATAIRASTSAASKAIA